MSTTPSPILTKAKVDGYLTDGNAGCPRCGAQNVEFDSIEVDGPGASQDASCPDCGLEWMDCYKLTGILIKIDGDLVEPSDLEIDPDPNDTLDDEPHDHEGPDAPAFDQPDWGSYSRHVEGN